MAQGCHGQDEERMIIILHTYLYAIKVKREKGLKQSESRFHSMVRERAAVFNR